VTGESNNSNFNALENLAYQNVSKWVKSWGAFAPQLHPEGNDNLTWEPLPNRRGKGLFLKTLGLLNFGLDFIFFKIIMTLMYL
jgi:hypothetical protein